MLSLLSNCIPSRPLCLALCAVGCGMVCEGEWTGTECLLPRALLRGAQPCLPAKPPKNQSLCRHHSIPTRTKPIFICAPHSHICALQKHKPQLLHPCSTLLLQPSQYCHASSLAPPLRLQACKTPSLRPALEGCLGRQAPSTCSCPSSCPWAACWAAQPRPALSCRRSWLPQSAVRRSRCSRCVGGGYMVRGG